MKMCPNCCLFFLKEVATDVYHCSFCRSIVYVYKGVKPCAKKTE